MEALSIHSTLISDRKLKPLFGGNSLHMPRAKGWACVELAVWACVVQIFQSPRPQQSEDTHLGQGPSDSPYFCSFSAPSQSRSLNTWYRCVRKEEKCGLSGVPKDWVGNHCSETDRHPALAAASPVPYTAWVGSRPLPPNKDNQLQYGCFSISNLGK